MGLVCSDPEIDKLFYAALAIKKEGKTDLLMMNKIRCPSEAKLKCALEGIDTLDDAIDVVYEYQQKHD